MYPQSKLKLRLAIFFGEGANTDPRWGAAGWEVCSWSGSRRGRRMDLKTSMSDSNATIWRCKERQTTIEPPRTRKCDEVRERKRKGNDPTTNEMQKIKGRYQRQNEKKTNQRHIANPIWCHPCRLGRQNTCWRNPVASHEHLSKAPRRLAWIGSLHRWSWLTNHLSWDCILCRLRKRCEHSKLTDYEREPWWRTCVSENQNRG